KPFFDFFENSTSHFRQMCKFRHDFWGFPRVRCVEKWIKFAVNAEFFTLSTDFSTLFYKNRVDLFSLSLLTSAKNEFVEHIQN
ncbi:MAG: hypothetical protein IKA43_05995, partial [Clostridia bacterium]|nr:hypothetical protein [Clostridia bacterium]